MPVIVVSISLLTDNSLHPGWEVAPPWWWTPGTQNREKYLFYGSRKTH